MIKSHSSSLYHIFQVIWDTWIITTFLHWGYCVFSTDDGHSFDQVLLFGHETTLTLFQVLFFALIDLASQNFILAGVCTYLIGEVSGDRFPFSIQYQKPLSNWKKYFIEKVPFRFVSFNILNIYKIDLIATLMSLHKGSSLWISEFPEADSAKFN